MIGFEDHTQMTMSEVVISFELDGSTTNGMVLEQSLYQPILK